jgi:hypothetical protein
MKKLIPMKVIFRRLKGHQKINCQAKCICGRKMYPSNSFSSGWACELELEILKAMEKPK